VVAMECLEQPLITFGLLNLRSVKVRQRGAAVSCSLIYDATKRASPEHPSRHNPISKA
jgi:hypothetical protein